MITYPVPLNSRWSVVRVSTSEILKHNAKWPRKDRMQIQGMDADLDMLLEVQVTPPAFDPLTEYLVLDDGVVDLAANTHTHTWVVTALPQGEIDSNTELETAKAFYQDLKNHVGTSAERLDRLDTVVAYLLKNLFGAA